MKDYQSYNTFCTGCNQENAIFSKQEGYRIDTICINCGLISTKTQKVNWRADRKRAIVDKDSHIARNPYRKAQ